MIKPTEYTLVNVADGHQFEDSGWSLSDPDSKVNSLIRARYAELCFVVDNKAEGLCRYHNWMPLKRCLKGSCAPVTYRSEGLANKLGLKNLYITFSGWWPEKGAYFKTCSFKETEAYSVCGRLPENENRSLVVASAGNTARAFAHVCSMNNIPLVLCIPLDNIDALWFDAPLNPCVRVLATPSGSDYFDAITLGDQLCRHKDYLAEGGAKNIARRDGMGTTILSFTEKTGRIPDFYFQAVGSGTGAIAAWENSLRLRMFGTTNDGKMRIIVSQNAPFTIMYDSWKLRQRDLVELSAEDARKQASIIDAKVLSNRKPPYSIAGGLYDTLLASDGDILSVSNDELANWKQCFLDLEGCDIHNAAAVATASLAQAVNTGLVGRDDVIMLNITGGGEERRRKELSQCGNLYTFSEPMILDPMTDTEEIVKILHE